MVTGSIAEVVPARFSLRGLAAHGGAQGAIAAVLALGSALFMSLGSRDFCLDDAWIHLAYAKSLQLGDGFSYNPGDHATGFSSPLWVLLLSLTPIARDPIVVAKCLGALCHAALAWGSACAAFMLSPVENRSRNAAAAGVIVALDPLLAFASGSGMEVSLTAALLSWSVFAIEAELAAIGGAILGALCVWARPECLFVLGPYCALRWAVTRRARTFAPLAGGLLALAAWVVYCQVVSGYPWPNTYYAKRNAQVLPALLYFVARVLPEQAWVLGVTGVVLFGAAFLRVGASRALAFAWLAAVVATAESRSIVTGVLFYSSRYFAIFGALPCIALASVLPSRRGFALAAALPIVAVGVLLLPRARALQRDQESDITAQHTEPAHYLARELPPTARLAVEGAGATRFFLPRSIAVIDVIGLNYAPAVHVNSTPERLCAVIRAQPTHLLLPDGFIEYFDRALMLEQLRTFVDESSAISTRSSVHRIHVARVVGVRPEARQMCGLTAGPGRS